MGKKTDDIQSIRFAGLPSMVTFDTAWCTIYRMHGYVDYPERGRGVDTRFFHSKVRQESDIHKKLIWVIVQNGRAKTDDNGEVLIADPNTSAELNRRQVIRKHLFNARSLLPTYFRRESTIDTPVPIDQKEWSWLMLNGIINRNDHGKLIIDTTEETFAEYPGRWEVFVDEDGFRSTIKALEREIRDSRPRNLGGRPRNFKESRISLWASLDVVSRGGTNTELIQWLIDKDILTKRPDGKYEIPTLQRVRGYPLSGIAEKTIINDLSDLKKPSQ